METLQLRSFCESWPGSENTVVGVVLPHWNKKKEKNTSWIWTHYSCDHFASRGPESAILCKTATPTKKLLFPPLSLCPLFLPSFCFASLLSPLLFPLALPGSFPSRLFSSLCRLPLARVSRSRRGRRIEGVLVRTCKINVEATVSRNTFFYKNKPDFNTKTPSGFTVCIGKKRS